MLERVRQDEVIDALRHRGLWDGKARRRRKQADPALIAERETSLKPCDPMKTWRNAGPWVRGSAADTYLELRGIELTDDEASACVSRRPYGIGRRNRAGRPCWRASRSPPAPRSPRTKRFFGHDGSGKAPLGKQARLFAAGGRTIGGGVWFGDADPDREFIVGEGIESTLSAMRIFGVTAGCAALSAFGIRRLDPAASRRAGCAFPPTTTSSARASPRRARPLGAGSAKGARLRRRYRPRSARTPTTSG